MLRDEDSRRRELAKMYAAYDDEMLLRHLNQELTELARAVLIAEIEIRELEASHYVGSDEEDSNNEMTQIRVWSGRTLADAELVTHMLSLDDIEASHSRLQGSDPAYRFQVSVAPDHAETALRVISAGILEAYAEESLAHLLQAEVVLPTCPICRSSQVTFEASSEENFWSCDKCMHNWEDAPLGVVRATPHASLKSSLVQAEDESTGVRQKKQRRRLNYLTVIANIVISAVVALSLEPQEWTRTNLFGLTLWVGGMLLWTIARWQLSSNLTGKAEAHDLVTTGIYARVQNPIYLSGAIVLIGISLYLERPWGLLIFAVLIPLQTSRIKRERAVLAESFGERYLQYRRQTWF
ncbi:protein-S-isoprenylcysteine O-methyltransferase Ste14 [Granulicella aggregans]|uniref:Protein-S-isoprenylcysteine O-methyltransferase Ste14 n=1 Tax=Granulicella aggregans TaxID=474949 RepID=A0A7W8E7A9_9BACT|nr:isoprenylcysteine carboxylmethyltransferase family protein [Granulicella aggregans]MBB5061219.1 protein-S-isoprenylcysteine O-methyltransferase Ste14 [Granulicella aggregans]